MEMYIAHCGEYIVEMYIVESRRFVSVKDEPNDGRPHLKTHLDGSPEGESKR